MDKRNIYEPFKKVKKRRSLREKRITAAIVLGLVFVLLASLFWMLKDSNFSFRQALGGDAETTTEEAEEELPDLPESNNYFLLWCTDNDKAELEFLWVVRLQLPEAKLSVFAPSVADSVDCEGSRMTIKEVYSCYGETGLVRTLSSAYGISFRAYIGSASGDFSQLVNYFGGVTVELDDYIDYKDTFTLILPKGTNNLKGDMLHNYLVYQGFGGGGDLTKRSEALILLLNKVFTVNYLDKSDTIYDKIIGATVTDINVSVRAEMQETLDYLFTNGFSSTAVMKNIDDLKS